MSFFNKIMTWGGTEWAALGQNASALFAAIGVIASFYMTRRTLREVYRDRETRQRPFIVFSSGGHRINVGFIKAGKAIPGVNPAYVAKIMPHLPDDAESVRIENMYGKLINFGCGPAIDIKVTWIPEWIRIGIERFDLDSRKLDEPIYSRVLNTIPSWESNLAPQGKTQVTRLPTFLEKDFEKKLTEGGGTIEINYQDVSQRNWCTRQSFYFCTGYKENPPWVHIIFNDIVHIQNTALNQFEEKLQN